MKKYSLVSALTILLAFQCTQTAWSAKLYKWVDKDGNISYQDSPPPEGSTLIREEEISTSAPSASAPSTSESATQSTVVFRQQPVTVYTVLNCPACESLLEMLRGWNIPVSEESLQDRAVQARILQESDSLSAPTLYIGENIISDQSEEAIRAELQQAGYQINLQEDEEAEAETEAEADADG